MPNFYIIILLFILLIILLTLISIIVASISIAPWVPIRQKDLARVNQLANLKSDQIFYDLGCGDGRVCFYIAKHNPKAKIIGIEIVFLLYLWAKFKTKFLGYKNVEIKFGNALKADLSSADVIYTFAIIKSINNQLKDKFIKELKPDGKIISYVFSIKNWPGQTEAEIKDKQSSLFVYKK